MNIVKRCALFALAALFVACGCGVQLDTEVMPMPSASLVAEELDLTPHREISPVLYFYNQSRTRFTAEQRTLSLTENESAELAIVRAVLQGPLSPDLLPVATDLRAQRVEVLPDLINVYLRSVPDAPVTARVLMVTKLALTAALVDYTGVHYVNVLLDGRQTGFTDTATEVTIPTGALTRVSDLRDELSTLEQEASAASFDTYAALYFLDATESFLLPEVTRFTYVQGTDAVRDLVALLLRGPQSTYAVWPSLSNGIELLSYEFVDEPNGLRMLRLTFNRMPVAYTSSFVDGERMAAASLTYTLTDYVPNIDGVELVAQANPTQVVGYRPEDFEDLLGNRLLVYLPNTTGGITMTGVERIVPQNKTDDPYERLRVLLQGPMDTDTRDVWPAAPDGISIENVLDVYTAGDVTVVNLDSGVADTLRDASVEDERVFVFSIVNTLTEARGVRRVLFLEDGRRIEYLGIKAICVLDPLMKDPGLIK